MFLILEILWTLPSSLPYVSLYIDWNPLLIASTHLRSALLTNGQVLSLNSNHGFRVDWDLFYWHQPFWGTYREEAVRPY